MSLSMLRLKCMILWMAILSALTGFSQTRPTDSIPQPGIESLAVDTSLDYEDMMTDLANFMDSILSPRSYFLISASASGGYFNYSNNAGTKIETRKKFVLAPVIGYYNKSGPGLNISANGTNTDQGFTFYQYVITPSFDLIQNRNWVGGFSYSRYFNKDSVKFYLTPLENELNTYFLYRKSWLQPGVSLSYGWGSKDEVKKKERLIRLLGGPVRVISTTNTHESISDFALNASLRHTFYWLNLSARNDYIRFTPMLVLSAGTQKYGFNQTTSTSSAARTAARVGVADLFRRNQNLDNKTEFQPLSLTLYLRPEYNIGKFFIQPQLLLDYYFPGSANNFTVVPSLNAGFIF